MQSVRKWLDPISNENTCDYHASKCKEGDTIADMAADDDDESRAGKWLRKKPRFFRF